MKPNFEMKGMDKLQKRIEELKKSIKGIEGVKNVSLIELIPDNFIKRNSKFDSLQKMVDSSAIEINSNKDFESEKWNNFVKENTKFSSWEEMISTAHGEWVKRKLKL